MRGRTLEEINYLFEEGTPIRKFGSAEIGDHFDDGTKDVPISVEAKDEKASSVL